MASSGRSASPASGKGAPPHPKQAPKSSTPQGEAPSTEKSTHTESEPTAPAGAVDASDTQDDAARPRPQSTASASADPSEIQIPSDPPSKIGTCRAIAISILQKLIVRLRGGEGQDASDHYKKFIRIAYHDGCDDVSCERLAVFDTGSPEDLISASFVEEVWGKIWSDQPKQKLASSHGHVDVYSLGRINLAWSSRDNPRNWLYGKLNFPPKTFRGTFHVVDLDNRDIIIGAQTIHKHKLLTFNHRVFGQFNAWRPATTKGAVSKTQAATSQAAAEVRRDEAERARALAEQQSQAIAPTTTAAVSS